MGYDIDVDATTILIDGTSFRINKTNKINIGSNCMIGCNFIFESQRGEIIIGNDSFINVTTNLIARTKIQIGNNVTIAWGCTIYDHNSHSLDWKDRVEDIRLQIMDHRNGKNFTHSKNWDTVKSKEIIIEDYAWIGFDCLILKGVTIGEGAIVGAGSVVRESVEPWTLVYGNPARPIKKLNCR
jgi:galactoside O-acetyltransferase